MKHRKAVFIILLSVVAVGMIAAGLYRVVRVYHNYRTDMLTYESRHLNSIVSSSARGLEWMLNGYVTQLEQILGRREFDRADEEYAQSGDAQVMRVLMARPDVRSAYREYSIAVYDAAGAFLASTDSGFPIYAGNDELIRDNIRIRADLDEEPWFVFGQWSDGGLLYYELAVRVHTVFAFHAEEARIGQHGYYFMIDREGRYFSYAGNGEIVTESVSELSETLPSIEPDKLLALAAGGERTPEEYSVYRFPWDEYVDVEGWSEETLVVAYPGTRNGGLVMGAAESFQEFNSFLTDTLDEVTWIILTELAGVLILILIATWVVILNRRDALELQAVRERADLMEEINRQQQSLARTERLQQLGVMTSGIVHEFNNMLTPIMSQSMLLLEGLADFENTPQFDYALDIYEAAENARDVLRRMSIMGKKDVDMGFCPLNIGSMLKKTMNLSAMAKDSHIQQELTLPDAPMYVSGNEQLLTQAFLNLCINGCQAMGTEGTLYVSAVPEARSGRQYVRVEVRDTGPGISEEKIGSLYEPFYTTKGEKGTGLGLAICQKIIETHKGTITAANGETCGAVFTVRIPTCDPPTEE